MKIWLSRKLKAGVLVQFYWIFKVYGVAGFDWRREKFERSSFDVILTITNILITTYFVVVTTRNPVNLSYSVVLTIGMNVLEQFPTIFVELYIVLSFMERRNFCKVLETLRRINAKVKTQIFNPNISLISFSFKQAWKVHSNQSHQTFHHPSDLFRHHIWIYFVAGITTIHRIRTHFDSFLSRFLLRFQLLPTRRGYLFNSLTVQSLQ